MSWGMQVSTTGGFWHPHSCQLRVHSFFLPNFLISDSHFCNPCTLTPPPSSSQQHIPICIFLISPSFATRAKFVISSFPSQHCPYWQYEWLCAQSSPPFSIPDWPNSVYLFQLLKNYFTWALVHLPSSCQAWADCHHTHQLFAYQDSRVTSFSHFCCGLLQVGPWLRWGCVPHGSSATHTYTKQSGLGQLQQ